MSLPCIHFPVYTVHSNFQHAWDAHGIVQLLKCAVGVGVEFDVSNNELILFLA